MVINIAKNWEQSVETTTLLPAKMQANIQTTRWIGKKLVKVNKLAGKLNKTFKHILTNKKNKKALTSYN